MITSQQIEKLLEAQDELNEKYTSNWKEIRNVDEYNCAFRTEFAEFLESSPRFGNWKFWKPYLENDVQNSKVEIVDMLHFGLSLILLENYKKGIHEIKISDKDIKEIEEYTEKLESEFGILNGVLRSLFVFEGDPNIKQLFIILSLCGKPFDFSLDQIYDAYYKKNKLNQTRIENGYLEGRYKKVDENGNEDNRKLKL